MWINEWWDNFKHVHKQWWIALDQFLNCTGSLFAPSKQAWSDETISSRCGRLIHRQPYTFFATVIDWIFKWFQGPNHCRNAYKKELSRYNFPPEMRS